MMTECKPFLMDTNRFDCIGKLLLYVVKGWPISGHPFNGAIRLIRIKEEGQVGPIS